LKNGEVKLGFNGDLYQESGADVVMTTKGDTVRYDSERERLGIGSTGQVLTVASSLPTWATLTTADSVLTTQGDVLYEGASGLARLGQSTDGYVLTTKGAGANPVWAEVSAGGGSYVRLDAQELGSDTSVITYTPLSPLTEEKYAMIVIVIETEVTSLGTLQMEINNLTTSTYYTDGSSWNAGSASIINTTNSKWDIMSSTTDATNSHTVVVLSMGDQQFAGEHVRGTAQGSSQDLAYFVGLENSTAGIHSISEIEVSNSAGNLKNGTKMTTYGVERS